MDQRGVTQKYTHEEYTQVLSERTNGNITPLEQYETANKSILHYCKKHDYKFMARPCKFTRKNNPQTGCYYCGLEKIGEQKRKTHETYIEELKLQYGDEYILLEKYKGSDVKIKYLHNTKTPHEFYITPNSLQQGEGCGVCKGFQVVIGYNDIATTHPEVAFMMNEYDKHHYTSGSHQEVSFTCPNCNKITKVEICEVVRRGLSCSYCSDGISFPNKFMYNCLMQIKDQFDICIVEYNPDWCTWTLNGKKQIGFYDFYIEKGRKKYIIEMDGGLGHGNKRWSGTPKYSMDLSTIKDGLKEDLARMRAIAVIRIDCDYMDIEKRTSYIINSIQQSRLIDIFDWDKVNYTEAEKLAQSSLLLKTVELYNNYEKEMLLSEISQKIATELKVNRTTVVHYLNRGKALGLCNYDSYEATYEKVKHPVICLNTGKIYDSIVQASKDMFVNVSSISKCCRKELKSGGRDKVTGEKLKWEYYLE